MPSASYDSPAEKLWTAEPRYDCLRQVMILLRRSYDHSNLATPVQGEGDRLRWWGWLVVLLDKTKRSKLADLIIRALTQSRLARQLPPGRSLLTEAVKLSFERDIILQITSLLRSETL